MFVAATFVCSHMLRNKTESITQNAQQQQKTWNTSETYRKKGKRAREKQGRKHNSTDGSVSWCVSFEMYRMFWFWCITALASCYQKWSVRSVCSFGQSFASFQIETFLSHRHTHTHFHKSQPLIITFRKVSLSRTQLNSEKWVWNGEIFLKFKVVPKSVHLWETEYMRCVCPVGTYNCVNTWATVIESCFQLDCICLGGNFHYLNAEAIL